jgi:LmbE family N-acetylglucosaminyl deacetylase
MGMKWIFLSPHLDDIAFSCGGLIWELAEEGVPVEIWTICAGEPVQSDLSALAEGLHQSWGLGLDAVRVRREEDRQACEVLGAKPRYFDFLDCIYRKSSTGEHFYRTGEEIFGGLDREEESLIRSLRLLLRAELPADARTVIPLGIGNHVDHELVRKAANRLEIPLLYYADYPYAREPQGIEILEFIASSEEWQPENFSLSAEALEKWFQAANTYQSQISTFWKDQNVLRAEIDRFSRKMGGVQLWKTVENH